MPALERDTGEVALNVVQALVVTAAQQGRCGAGDEVAALQNNG